MKAPLFYYPSQTPVLLLLVLLFPFSIQAKARLLNGREYFESLVCDIDQSRVEIRAAMYLIALPEGAKEGHPVKTVLDKLIQARKRGVEVHVLLDSTAGLREGEEATEGKNSLAALYLKNGGVEVSEDRADLSLHSKITVIDKKTVYVGSCNWSEYALTRNIEHTIREEDPELAAKALLEISAIPVLKKDEPVPNEKMHRLPGNWIRRESKFLHLFSSDAPRSFDLVLLLYCFQEQKPGYEFLSERLALTGDNTAKRRALNRTLRELEKDGFIKLEMHFKGDFSLTFCDSTATDFFLLPSSYYSHGWDKVLSLEAKTALLILLREMDGKKEKMCWLNEAPGKYGLSNEVLKGRQELREWNIISVEPSPMKDGRHEGPSLVRFSGLFDREERENRIRELSKKYSGEETELARKRAAVVYENYSPERIEDLVFLARKFKPEDLDFAFRQVADLRPDNPRRSMKYVAGILKKRGE